MPADPHRDDNQDRRIDTLSDRVVENSKAIARLDARFDTQDQVLSQIKDQVGGTSSFLRDELTSMRKREEKREEREAKAAQVNQQNTWKLVMGVLALISTMLTAGYVAGAQVPVASPAPHPHPPSITGP